MTVIPLKPNQKNKPKVNPSGPRNSKIIILTDSPGESDEATGYPLTGSSGALLTQLLNQTGITRNECYISSVVKYAYPQSQYDRLIEQDTSLYKSMEECRVEL